MKLAIYFLSSILVINDCNAALIGYGSSDAVLPSKNQELFYMGFELGMQKYVDKKTYSELVESIQISNGSQLGAQSAARTLVKNGSKLLVGFPTSHEALLASKATANNDVVFIFAGAGHSELGKLGKRIYTTGESMETSIKASLDFIETKFKGKKGALIGNPFAVFSRDQDTHFKEFLKEPHYSKVSIEFHSLNKNLQLDPTVVQKLKNNKFDYVILTPYADESGKILEQFEKSSIDLPIISNSSWTTGDVDYIRRFLTNKKQPSFCPSFLLSDNKDRNSFLKLFKNKFGKDATSESSYGYDLGVIVGQIISKVGKNPKIEDLINSIQSNKCFKNTSSGKICFPKSGGHSIRKLNFYKFTKQGFKLAD